MELRVFDLINDSIVDGPGLRFCVFVQGCLHNCKGCHNPMSHDLNGGYLVSNDKIICAIKENPLLDGVTFSGGEPFLQAVALTNLAIEVKKLGLNIVTYTGFLWEELIKNNIYLNLLYQTDILIDGRFDISKRDLSLKFRGSSNQRVIDVKKSFINKKICEYEF
jgi:anaerobic ribonucleoside-triphosphate reductase activating protein